MKTAKGIHKHTNFLAPVFICLAFGLAGVAAFAALFPGSLPSVSAMTYEDCAALKDSRIQESYPPVCVTKSGKQYTKDLPKVKMPETASY